MRRLLYVLLLFVLIHLPALLEATLGQAPNDNSVWDGGGKAVLRLWSTGLVAWGIPAAVIMGLIGAAIVTLVTVAVRAAKGRTLTRSAAIRVVLAIAALGPALTLWFAVGMQQTG